MVSQHKNYGMIHDADLAINVNLGKMIPYIYSIDTPVSDADYATLMENNFPPPYKYGSAGLWRGKDEGLLIKQKRRICLPDSFRWRPQTRQSFGLVVLWGFGR